MTTVEFVGCPNLDWKTLDKNKTSSIIKSFDVGSDETDSRNFKQKSEEWFVVRKRHMSASAFSGYFGMWTQHYSCISNKRVFYQKNVMKKEVANIISVYKEMYDSGSYINTPFPRHIMNVNLSLLENTKSNSFPQLRMEWGTKHEDNALVVLSEEIGTKLHTTGFWSSTWFTEYEGEIMPIPIGASPDALIVEKFTNKSKDPLLGTINEEDIIEVKCTYPFENRKQKPIGPENTNPNYGTWLAGVGSVWENVMEYYIPQVQMQLNQTDKKRCVLIQYTASNGCGVFFIERDDDYIALMKNMLAYLVKHCFEHTFAPDTFWSTYPYYENFVRRSLEISTNSKKTTISRFTTDRHLKNYIIPNTKEFL